MKALFKNKNQKPCNKKKNKEAKLKGGNRKKEGRKKKLLTKI